MPPSNIQGAALIGRRVGIALFWCLAVFVIGASARSIIGELFFSGAPSATTDEAACAATMRSLHDTLIERASQTILSGDDGPRTPRWLTDWDREFAATSGQCGRLRDTRKTLLALRERIEALLRRYDREDRPLSKRLERALQGFAPRTTPPTET